MFLRQSTSQVIRFGPFSDATDAKTAETGLTIAQGDMQLSKDGGAFAQKSAAGNATHDADGWYSTTLSTTDTNTVGELRLQVDVAGALNVWDRWYVVEEAVYDAFYAASAGMAVTLAANAVSATAIASNAITAAKIATDAITAAKIAANAIGASELAADAVTEIQSGLATASALSTVDGNVDSILADTNELQSDDIPATLATIAGYIDTEIGTLLTNVAAILTDTGTTLDGKIDAIKAVTDNLPDSGALSTIDGIVDAIKAKTDDLTFGVAGKVDANVTHINETAVTGVGTEGDPWGP